MVLIRTISFYEKRHLFHSLYIKNGIYKTSNLYFIEFLTTLLQQNNLISIDYGNKNKNTCMVLDY